MLHSKIKEAVYDRSMSIFNHLNERGLLFKNLSF